MEDSSKKQFCPNKHAGLSLNSDFSIFLGVLLEYPTTTGFQWGHLKNSLYTYTVSGRKGRVRYSKTWLFLDLNDLPPT